MTCTLKVSNHFTDYSAKKLGLARGLPHPCSSVLISSSSPTGIRPPQEHQRVLNIKFSYYSSQIGKKINNAGNEQ